MFKENEVKISENPYANKPTLNFLLLKSMGRIPFAYTAVVFIYHTLLKLKNNNFYFYMRNNLISNPATVDSFSSSKNGRFKIKEDKDILKNIYKNWRFPYKPKD